jgi:hypothetical protein
MDDDATAAAAAGYVVVVVVTISITSILARQSLSRLGRIMRSNGQATIIMTMATASTLWFDATNTAVLPPLAHPRKRLDDVVDDDNNTDNTRTRPPPPSLRVVVVSCEKYNPSSKKDNNILNLASSSSCSCSSSPVFYCRYCLSQRKTSTAVLRILAE